MKQCKAIMLVVYTDKHQWECMHCGCNTRASELALFFYIDWYLELDLDSS